jgi:hypothetical protein
MKVLVILCVFLVAITVLAAPVQLVFEAEAAVETEAPMVAVAEDQVPPGSVFVPGASGSRYLEIPEKAGNPPKLKKGLARYTFELPDDGDYTLWARVWWEGECSNSFTVQIDEGAPFLFGENATYRTWHWVKYPVARMTPPFRLKQGPHVMIFKNREDGVRLDQIVLSPNKRFVPVDIERVTTGGGTP